MKNENENKTTTAEVTDRGPLKITGKVYLKDVKRDINETVSEVFLCLCGRSGNKPYCDDTHKR